MNSKKLGIMQPYFLPYIGYWQLMNYVDNYIIYDDVNFIKGGWINRNNICLQGKTHQINVKMQGASSNKKINEIEIAQDSIYFHKLLKTLEGAYKNAPYFTEVYPVLEDIILNENENLAKYLACGIETIAKYLDMNTKFVMSSDLNKNCELKGEEKVIHICELLKADQYINAIGGRELYSKEHFEKVGIKLEFLCPDQIVYEQQNKEFIPNLSIVDVLMNNSKEEVKEMLKKFELV